MRGTSLPVLREVAAPQEMPPGWRAWRARLPGRVEWLAVPDGARMTVVNGRASVADLIAAVREYERDIDQHLADARQRLAEAAHSGTGDTAVLEALIPALSKIQERLSEV